MQNVLSDSSVVRNASLHVSISGIEDGRPIPEKFASCAADGHGGTRQGGNVNPAIHWAGAPQATQSYAIIVVDKDVPANFESANKQGKTISMEASRKDFYHWVLVDIPVSITHLPENTRPVGIVGRNDMAAKHSVNGYDGACPPWNDERLHHYHFRVYALDVPSLGLKPPFTGKMAEDAMQGHIMAQGEVVGTYTTNNKMKKAA